MELLPAGFRFFPTDEELITCYLARKAMDDSFSSPAIRDVDLYKSEPWDLPCEQQQQQQQQAAAAADLQEGYFFSRRGSKYPSGVRARRATRLGYWKSTGKDKAVHGRGRDVDGGGRLVGTRKTLVFYRGRAPRGEKTGWVMHEYAMGEKSSSALLRGAQSEWVICKVFMRKQHPTSGERKVMTTEETVHDQDSTPGLLLPIMAPDGSDDGEQEAAPPPPVVAESWSQQLTINHSGAHALDGNETKDPHHHRHQMVREEIPAMMNQQHGLVCASPSWLNHDDHLGAQCSTLSIMQKQSHAIADYYLPELLEHDDYDDLSNPGLGLLDSGGEASQSSEIISAAIGPLHLDGLYWNFGF